MTVQEFRYEFDLLYNNIMSDMAPGLDDYEVSMFLTTAQEQLVTQLYAGKVTDGFENTEEIRRNLANLIVKGSVVPSSAPVAFGSFWRYSLPISGDILVLIAEQAKISDSDCCNKDKYVNVVPVKYDEINKFIENPFRRPNNHRAWRLDDSTTQVSIVVKTTMSEYFYEYLKKPAPIVLANLGTYTVNGVSTPQTSALDESLHRPIIKLAVQLAAASWASNNKN